MSVEITVGQATVKLDGYEVINSAGRASVTYNFDDMLHAVCRLAGAVLTDQLPTALVRLDELRKELSNG